MRIRLKNSVSLLLVFGLLAALFLFPNAYAASDTPLSVTLNCNGGKLTGFDDPDLQAGDPLPGIDQIARGNLIFAGWYENSDFSGGAFISVPADATGEKTYYAKWVANKTITYDFDTTGLKTTNSEWSDWVETTRISLNEDPNHASSGNCSAKYVIPASPYPSANIFVSDSLMVDGDGVRFWIETDHPITLYLQFKKSAANSSSDVTVPVGKSVVTIPWSDIKNAPADGQWAGNLQILSRNVTEATVLYLDDVGTYSKMEGISFDPRGGEFVTPAPIDYYPGMPLPGYADVTSKYSLIFAGWYESADLAGNPVYAVPADASGEKTYYAKWAIREEIFDNFDDTPKNWVDNTGMSDMSVSYDDAAHANSGTKSLKYTIPNQWAAVYSKDAFAIKGDGIYFWIDVPQELTVKVAVNYKTNFPEITVPVGKSYVFAPWSSFDTAIEGRDKIEIFYIYFTAPNGTVLYLDDVGTYQNACSHVFGDEVVCSLCGAKKYDYNDDDQTDILDLVTLKNRLTDAGFAADVRKDDDGTVEEADVAKVRRQLLGVK